MEEQANDVTASLRTLPRDAARWHRFIEYIYPAVMHTAFHLSHGNRDRAEEIVQESFVRFLKSDIIQRVQTCDQAVAYLRQTVRHLAVDEFRRSSRLEPYDEHAEYLQQSMFTPDTDETLAGDLAMLLNDLSNSERELLELMLERHDISALASRLGISYSATAVRVHRLVRRLRDSANLLADVKKPAQNR